MCYFSYFSKVSNIFYIYMNAHARIMLIASSISINRLTKAVKKAIHTPERPIVIVYGPPGSGKSEAIEIVSQRLNLELTNITESIETPAYSPLPSMRVSSLKFNVHNNKISVERQYLKDTSSRKRKGTKIQKNENKKIIKGYIIKDAFPTTPTGISNLKKLCDNTSYLLIIETTVLEPSIKEYDTVTFSALSEFKITSLLNKNPIRRSVNFIEDICLICQGNYNHALNIYSFWENSENVYLSSPGKHIDSDFHGAAKLIHPKEINRKYLLNGTIEISNYSISLAKNRIVYNSSHIEHIASILEDFSLFSKSTEENSLFLSLLLFKAAQENGNTSSQKMQNSSSLTSSGVSSSFIPDTLAGIIYRL
eukprot:GHVP01061040.1.p1 GENE.GHVP01061040.1~~GHVP01061040.1.p1  ORF type:complete len:365 (-),score=51.93 GHVP01061040.1:2665-3759(-)